MDTWARGRIRQIPLIERHPNDRFDDVEGGGKCTARVGRGRPVADLDRRVGGAIVHPQVRLAVGVGAYHLLVIRIPPPDVIITADVRHLGRSDSGRPELNESSGRDPHWWHLPGIGTCGRPPTGAR